MAIAFATVVQAQVVERPRPAGWERLVPGGRFMDRFEVAEPIGNGFTTNCWGGENVKPRDVHNGIEDAEYSYWGGNIVKEEVKIGKIGQFDWVMFACAPTLLNHPPDLVEFVAELKAAGVFLIDSAVFNGGFLLGSDMLDYRKADPVADAAAFSFREKYLARCSEFGLDPAVPAVQSPREILEKHK